MIVHEYITNLRNNNIIVTVQDEQLAVHDDDGVLTKKIVEEMAQSAPINADKVAKIKEAISTGKYPLDLDKLSDALMQAYREMKS